MQSLLSRVKFAFGDVNAAVSLCEKAIALDAHQAACTSALKGTVGAPCRMGHSHAIYNPSDKPVEFMNITTVKGKYDAFNLDDARAEVAVIAAAPDGELPRRRRHSAVTSRARSLRVSKQLVLCGSSSVAGPGH